MTARASLVKSIDERRDLNAQLTGELQDAQQKLQATLSAAAAGRPAPAPNLPLRPFQGTLPWPADGVMSSQFGRQPANSPGPPVRNGIELSLPEGQPVTAVHGGTVAYADLFSGYANLVIVEHGSGTYSLYGHLSGVSVKKGDRVEAGTTVGTAGRNPAGNPSTVLRTARRRQARGSPTMAEAMTTRTRLSVLLISTPLLAFIVLGGMMGKASGGDQTFQHLRVFEDVVSLILNNYVEDAKVDKVMEGAMRGLADGLDPDSAYLTAAEVKSIEPGEKLPGGDVGIELTRQYHLRIIAARDDSPAAKAGLQTGDYVRAIDGKAARDLSVFEGMRLLRGAPGTKVTLTIIRGNAAEPRQIELVREKTPGAVVTGKMLPDGLGYIRIAAFGADTAAKTEGAGGRSAEDRREASHRRRASHGGRAVRNRYRRRTRVREVRDAGDGVGPRSAGAAAAVRSAPPTQGRPADAPAKVSPAAIKETITAKAGDGAIALPVTLLVTTGTSGAAELFAAALDGNNRAAAGRRAHARPRRHPEAGAAARRPRALADLRPLSHPRR